MHMIIDHFLLTYSLIDQHKDNKFCFMDKYKWNFWVYTYIWMKYIPFVKTLAAPKESYTSPPKLLLSYLNPLN